MTTYLPRESAVEDIRVRGDKGYAGLGRLMVELSEQVSWATGKEFTGLTITQKEEGWLMTLRVRDGAEAQVAFIGALTLLDLWRNLWVVLFKDKLKFRKDRYRQ